MVAPQIYGNGDRSWIARGAGQLESIFQALVQRGANGMGAPPLIGTNHLYRTKCWQQIGGYQDAIIEDHLTAMAVYGAVNPATGNRWRGVYTPDILAVGEGPTTFTDWFAQQMRWSWGMWQIISRHSARMLPKMSLRQRVSYTLLQPFYPLAAPVAAVDHSDPGVHSQRRAPGHPHPAVGIVLAVLDLLDHGVLGLVAPVQPDQPPTRPDRAGAGAHDHSRLRGRRAALAVPPRPALRGHRQG